MENFKVKLSFELIISGENSKHAQGRALSIIESLKCELDELQQWETGNYNEGQTKASQTISIESVTNSKHSKSEK